MCPVDDGAKVSKQLRFFIPIQNTLPFKKDYRYVFKVLENRRYISSGFSRTFYNFFPRNIENLNISIIRIRIISMF